MKEPKAKPTKIPRRAMYPYPEACVLLGDISVSTLYNQIAAGVVRAAKIGNRSFIAQGEIDRLAAGGDDAEAA